MMMLMMLTAFMGFALQSCGSDDDNDDTRQTYTIGLEIVDKGDLTAEDVAMVNTKIQQAVSKAETTVTATFLCVMALHTDILMESSLTCGQCPRCCVVTIVVVDFRTDFLGHILFC